MRLLELFDKVARYDVIYDNLSYSSQEDRYFRAIFTVAHGTPNRRRYEVNVDAFNKESVIETLRLAECQEYIKTHFEDDAIFLGISFESEIPGSSTNSFMHASSTTDITGFGNQFEVMATVVKITKDATRKTQASGLFFGSREPNRTKLYRTMSKRFGTHQVSFEFPQNETVFLVHV